MRTLRHTILLALLVALGGCVSTDFTPLNTNYEVLVQKQTTLSTVDPNSVQYAQGQDEVIAGYKTLAADAYKLSAQADNAATKVSILRLTAIAAWQGGDDALSQKAESEGMTACRTLGNNGAPRDCAILAYLPTLRSYKPLADRMKILRKSDTPSTADIAETIQLLPKIDDLRQQQERVLPGIMSATGPYAGISPSTQTYLATVAQGSACLAVFAYTIGQKGTGLQGSVELVNTGIPLAQNYAGLLFTAKVIPASDPNWIRKASCAG